MVMLVLAAWAVWAVLKDKVSASPRLLALLVPTMALPYIANTTGWIFTEIGRVPWIVFGLMTLEQGVSIAVTAGEVLFSLVVFTLVYAALIVANVYLLRKYATAGLAGPESSEPTPEAAPAEA
jgi:cytochrome d ubiquinol oxidase subunit I